jgi:hypothetical protein
MRASYFLFISGLIWQTCVDAQNIGLGTTTPQARLHVSGTTSNIAIFNGANSMWLTLSENGIERGYIGSFAGGPEDVDFGTYGSNLNGKVHLTTSNQPRLTVIQNGNVGIGTITPQKLLSVASGAVIDQNNNNTGTSSSILSFGSLSGEGIGSKRTDGANQFGLDFYTNNAQRMTITNAGRVGIGTNNPQTTLDVNGDVNIENRLLLNNSTGNSGQVLVSNGNAAPSWQNMSYGNNDRFFYVSDDANTFGMDDDTLGFSQRYAYSSAITYSNKIFTVNKSGLYRFQGNIQPIITTTGNTVYPRLWAGWFFSFQNSFYSIMNDVFEYAGNNSWRKSKQYEFDFYLTQGSTFVFYLSTTTSSGTAGVVSKNMHWSPVSINLISE